MKGTKVYVGIDLGGTNLKSALFDEEFQMIAERRVTAFSEAGSEAILQQITENIELLWAENGVSAEENACVGIGIPGLLDHKTGVAFFAANFKNWKDVPVAEQISARLGVPVFIDNDVRVNLYGEWLFGAGQERLNIVLLTLGTGLGAGILLDGKVLYGATSSAGEIGHMNMFRDGRPCNCGSCGCFGRYVSARGLCATFQEKLQQGQDSILSPRAEQDSASITAQMIAEAFDKGDRVSIEAFRETGEIFGVGLANIINLYNPEMIIVGGGMANAKERLLKSARKTAERYALKAPFAACSIVTAHLGDAAGLFGAAIMAKNRLYGNL